MMRITALLIALAAVIAASADPTPIRFGAAKTNDTFYAASDIKALAFKDSETDPNVPSWAKAASKPTYTASEVGALGNTGAQNLNGSLSFYNGNLSFVFWDAVLSPAISLWDGLVSIEFPSQSGTLALTSDIAAASDNIPSDVSNIVTQAYIQDKLGVYLYIGQDGGIYVHTGE